MLVLANSDYEKARASIYLPPGNDQRVESKFGGPSIFYMISTNFNTSLNRCPPLPFKRVFETHQNTK